MNNYLLQSGCTAKARNIGKTKITLMNMFFPPYTEWELFQMKNIGGQVYNVYAQTNKLTGKVRFKKSKAKFVNRLIRHQ